MGGDNKQTERETLTERLKKRNPGQPEFIQAVEHVLDDIWPVYLDEPDYRHNAILDRLTEPDRVISFRVTWEDDACNLHVNRGIRVQHNSAIGPYKGGLRFTPDVDVSVLKFLAFEQTFKNALTGLPMGGGKGGADFDPRGRSDREIQRFCQSFMTELFRHIGPDTDVPAGDINVGQREIGYMFGTYRRIRNEFEGSLTGKGTAFGGSELRVEATGYGLMHFVQCMLATSDRTLEGLRIAVSGAGNVATHAAQCAAAQGAKIVSLSDSGGALCVDDGLEADQIQDIRAHKSTGGRLADYAERHGLRFSPDAKPWELSCDIALPCATQNELGEDDARALVDNGCWMIAEGANMPLTPEARRVISEAGLPIAPAKAANAGGVAVSGLEITQNQIRRSRSRDEISAELRDIMKSIHDTCVEHGQSEDGTVNYCRGANIAGFRKVADAMLAQGIW